MPAYKDSKTGTWFVKFYCKDWTGENKQIKKRGFATKREALDYERNYKIRQENNLDMTFGEFWKLYTEDVKNYVKLNTWLTKEHIVDTKILPYFKNLKMNEITPGDVRKWQNEMVAFRYENGKSYSQTYKKTMHNILSAIFNHACRFYNLKSNPARQAGNMGREEKKEMLFWTTEEYKKFSEAVIDKPVSFYSFEMLYWTGMRLGELLALTMEDFDFEKNTVRINKSYQRLQGQDVITTPKTSKSNRTTANYGVGIRRYLVETGHVRKIIDLFDTKFFGAAVLPAIILCENSDTKSPLVEYIGIKTSEKKGKQKCCNATELFEYIEKIGASKEYVEYGDDVDCCTFEISKGHSKLPMEGKTWNLSSDNESQIKMRMEREKLCCLQDILDVCVGIKTTADTVFVKPMTEDFIKKYKFEDEVVYPLIQSFDVERWSIKWGENKRDRYILYPHKEENGIMKAYRLEEIPNAANYLLGNSEILKGRKYLTQSKTREWYECWVPQKLSKFRQTKIVTRDIVSSNTFALDEEGYLCQGNTFFLTRKESLFATKYADMSEHEFYCFVLGIVCTGIIMISQELYQGLEMIKNIGKNQLKC